MVQKFKFVACGLACRWGLGVQSFPDTICMIQYDNHQLDKSLQCDKLNLIYDVSLNHDIRNIILDVSQCIAPHGRQDQLLMSSYTHGVWVLFSSCLSATPGLRYMPHMSLFI